MSKLKKSRFAFLIVVIVGLVLMFFYIKSSNDNEDEFTQLIQKVDYVCVIKYPFMYVLTDNQLIQFKNILMKNYENGNYRTEELSQVFAPLAFKVRSKDKKFTIRYLEENNELYFYAPWVNDKKNREKMNDVHNLLLPVYNDIIDFLNEIGFPSE